MQVCHVYTSDILAPRPSDLNREQRLEQPELLAVRSWPGQGKMETPRSEREERGGDVTTPLLYMRAGKHISVNRIIIEGIDQIK